MLPRDKQGHRAKAFQRLIHYADGHRSWDIATSAAIRDRTRHPTKDGEYPVTPATVPPPNPLTGPPPTQRDGGQTQGSPSGKPHHPQYPLCVQPPALLTPARRQPLTYEEIRMANGEQNCHVFTPSKTETPQAMDLFINYRHTLRQRAR